MVLSVVGASVLSSCSSERPDFSAGDTGEAIGGTSGDGDGDDNDKTGGTSGNGGGNQGSGGGGAVEPGQPCGAEGEVDCASAASIARLICQDGFWSMHEPCTAGRLCAPSGDNRGKCQFIAAECEGRSPNESFCDGVARKTCSEDLLSFQSKRCPSLQHCNLGSGPHCAPCLPGTFECDGDVLMTCTDDATGFTERDCTDEGLPCNATAGDCTANACSKGQLRCGTGDILEICNDSLSAFEPFAQCEAGLCNSSTKQCDACVAGASYCDEGRRLECSDDGQMERITICGSSTPYCVGAGNCVQCLNETECPNVGECLDRACDNSTCNPIPKTINTSCTGGICDGNGTCVQCTSTDQSHCPSSAPVCVSGSCAECKPGEASECASTCSREVRTCSSSGSWQKGSACSGNSYCSGGSCIADTVTLGWPLASGSTRTVDGPIAQRIEIECRSIAQYMGAYFDATSGFIPMAIYEHDSTTNSPGDVLWNTTYGGNIASDGSLTVTLDEWSIDAGSYWLAMYPIGSRQIYHSSSGEGQYGTGNFDNGLRSPFQSSGTYSGSNHMYLVVHPSP